MENDKVKEAINKMIDAAGGDLVVVGERLFKQGIIPEELIVTTDYTVFANDINKVFEFDETKKGKGIRNYFENSEPDAEYIRMLGFQKDSKDEIIELLSKGSLYYDETLISFVKAGQKFKGIKVKFNNKDFLLYSWEDDKGKIISLSYSEDEIENYKKDSFEFKLNI